MTGKEVFFLLLGASAGGFINGLAGFGTALFALGFFLTVMTPVQAVSLVILLAIVSGLQGAWIVRHSIADNPARLMRFLLPALVGIPIGITTLTYIDAKQLKLVIAIFLLVYGAYFTFKSNLPSIDRRTPLVDAVVGFAGGLLGGMASLSGALPTMWCSMRTWTKGETRAVLQPFNIAVLAVTAAMLAFRGVYTQTTLLYFAIALPASMIAAQVGITIFKRLTDQQFRRMLIAMTFIAGTILLLRELL
ncbi:MAG: sulfite exporter TauE/SafE family protein [Rhizobiaceae bacterium]|jgi:hypothetical protein|nr:sulfite exporter TauE/SafE family protein [Rhizobiaceae bacterium]